MASSGGASLGPSVSMEKPFFASSSFIGRLALRFFSATASVIIGIELLSTLPTSAAASPAGPSVIFMIAAGCAVRKDAVASCPPSSVMTLLPPG